MIYKLIVFFSIVFISCFGYSQSDSLYFSVTSYYTGTELYKTDTISIKNTKKTLDVYFYKEHFNQFYGLPKKLVRKKYKNQEIVEWAFNDKPKEFKKNWSHSYTYDAQGKLIEYEYSGCVICSQFPWGFSLVYDENNTIIKQQTYLLSQTVTVEQGKPITHMKPHKQSKNCIQLTYDSEGNVILLEKYNPQGISEKIQLLK
ncbi:hypothetical protein ACFO3O_03435 [Dokdonia ponticola]|uniref:RHS repeat protein n=1 Tax=Dokdonia ponticola TaxID=2041041 RepID=A0ABV9HTW9_9FLAO